MESVERRLAALLSADAVGYTRLMAQDDVATVRTITAYRGVISDCVEAHRGRVAARGGRQEALESQNVFARPFAAPAAIGECHRPPRRDGVAATAGLQGDAIAAALMTCSKRACSKRRRLKR